MRVLVVGPGASWSTADVYAGLVHGLKANGVTVFEYALDGRIVDSNAWLMKRWRIAKKVNPAMTPPTKADVFYHAGMGALERALRNQVDAVVIVSGMYLHPDVVIMMRQAGLLLTVLCTESPYDIERELTFARLCHGVWTNERTSVEVFRSVCPNVAYLPHAWHPQRHQADLQPNDLDAPAHDVVFVGSAFRERVEFLNAIDWTGIDFALYGNWDGLGSRNGLRRYVKAYETDNRAVAAIYRRAKIVLNLYRTSKGWGRHADHIMPDAAESLSPRAYELAACGVFHLSEPRAEVREVFGDLVPTFTSPVEAAALIRLWLADNHGRARVAASLPAVVAESSWVHRARQVKTDLESLISAARGQAA